MNAQLVGAVVMAALVWLVLRFITTLPFIPRVPSWAGRIPAVGASVVLVMGMMSALNVASRQSPTRTLSAFEAVDAASVARLNAVRGFEAATSGLSPAAMRAKVQELSVKGSARLEDSTLFVRAGIYATLLSVSSDSTCAALLGGQLSVAQAAELASNLRSLGIEAYSRAVDIRVRAVSAELLGLPVHSVSDSEGTHAIATVVDGLPTNERTRTLSALQPSATVRERAWAARKLYDLAALTIGPEGTVLRRVLANW